jgi:hypothetical protein
VGDVVCADAYEGSSMQFLQSEETDCDGTLAAAINDLLDEYLGPYEGGNSPHAAWVSCTEEGFLKITDDDEYVLVILRLGNRVRGMVLLNSLEFYRRQLALINCWLQLA